MDYIWISIQSDFGITMGELGSLSSQTDSRLIASTLMALKDIVSIEASSGESRFMTGNVETSSFGTFSISLSEQSKLIMSYIISAESGHTVDDETVDLVQSLCTNFGKQLVQFGNISFLATSGAALPRDILIKAFLNACTIVRMENNLPINKRSLNKGYKEVIKENFNNPEEMLDAFNYIMDGEDWQKDNTIWSDGFLTPTAREKLYTGFSNHMIFSLANKDPRVFLYAKEPREEPKKMYHRIKNELNERLNNPYEPIIANLEGLMKGKVEKYMHKIPLVDLHTSEINVYNEFVRASLLKSMKKDPLIAFALPEKETIQNEFAKYLPDIDIEHTGTILLKALKSTLHESAYDYVELFFTKFMQEMTGITLTQTAMDLLIAFAQQFISGKEIADQLKSLDNVDKKWIRDLTKFIGNKEIKQLKIDSIDEGIILTNAASSGVVNTLAKTIADQFLLVEGKLGEVLDEMISFYLSSGPTIKSTSILVSILESLAETDYDVELITPLYRDFISAGLIKNNYSIVVNEIPIPLQKKKGNYIVQINDGEMLYSKFIEESKEIKLNISEEKQLNINLGQFDEITFLDFINDPELIIESTRLAIERRLQNYLVHSFDEWVENIKNELDKFQFYFSLEDKKPSLSDAIIQKLILPKQNLLGLKLGNHVDEISTKIIDEINNLWEHLQKEWTGIKDEIRQKNEINKKFSKKIGKSCQNTMKSISNSRVNLLKIIDDLVKEIMKVIKTKKNAFKIALHPSEMEILSFKYDGADLLPTKENTLMGIDELTQTIEGLREGELEQLSLSVSLSLFENPPDTVLEYAYNEMIRGKVSKTIKNVLNKVNTKKEFENYFKEQAENYAASVYDGLSKLIDNIMKTYIAKDGIVTSDGGRITLQIGRIPISRFPRQKLIDELLSLPSIKFTRETSNWLVSFDFSKLKGFKSEEPRIVTFSDAVRYVHRQSFKEKVGSVFDGLSTVGSLIEKEAGVRINNVMNNLCDAIFDMS